MMTLNRLIQDSDLAADEKRKAQHNLRRATADEFDILYRLFEIPEARKFVGEIFRGAHVRNLLAEALFHADHQVSGGIRPLSARARLQERVLCRVAAGKPTARTSGLAAGAGDGSIVC